MELPDRPPVPGARPVPVDPGHGGAVAGVGAPHAGGALLPHSRVQELTSGGAHHLCLGGGLGLPLNITTCENIG